MKNILLNLFAFIFVSTLNSQTVFWTEDFGSDVTCNTNQLANGVITTNGTWSVVSTGTNGVLFPNEWYISAVEAGMGVGNCGDGCTPITTFTNRTLHISTGISDLGASYIAGFGAETDKRAQSPTINCTNKTSITMNLSYIMYGVINTDFCQLYFSPDNGLSWVSLGIPAQTPTLTCSGQGIWTSFSVALPSSANNNASVKLGFRWKNTDPNGADPSVAIDDITLSATTSTTNITLTPTFTIQNTLCKGDSTSVQANTGTTSATGYSWTTSPSSSGVTTPNSPSTFIKFNNSGTYTISLTVSAGTLIASTTQTILINPNPTISVSSSTLNVCIGSTATLSAVGAQTYTWFPGNNAGTSVVISPTTNTTYSCNGTSVLGCKGNTLISITVSTCNITTGLNTITTNENLFSFYPNPTNDKIYVKLLAGNINHLQIEIMDVIGKNVMIINLTNLENDSTPFINVSALSKGLYILNTSVNGKPQKPTKLIKE
jgi:hypothetical protein